MEINKIAVRDVSTASILIVDDDPSTLSLLRWALKGCGVRTIHTHTNAMRALSQIIGENLSVDLIFCDLSMPHMDGVEFIRRLAEIGYQGGLIVVTGEDGRVIDMVKKLTQAQSLNWLGCLEKPVSGEALRSALGQWVNHVPALVKPASQPISAKQIRTALAERQFINYYQPKVDLLSGLVVGAESLIRWQRSAHEIVPPGRFIGIAENNGLIEQITRYVVAEAALQAKRWLDMGARIPISINVSMDDLAQLDFPEFIASETACAGIPPSSLVLEITESRLMKDPMAVLDVLTRLRLKRFRLSIDDFGTGYSSLAQLRDISFDELKIDLGFVHGACDDPKMQAIVEGSRRIAKQLGMTVVAEGVEDRADWDFIRLVRCDQAQGYFIAKPMAASGFMDWLSEWNRRVPELIRELPL
jgi:EAL domain-containing protein (putative c-di-GMP-specific phosphodiesterase class I)